MIGTYLVDSIVLRMDKGMDTWQEPLATTDVTIRAFIEYGEHWIQDVTGQMVVSMAKVHMRPRDVITSGFSTRATNTISYKDLLVFDGSTHKVMRINKGRDFSIRALVVYVG